MRTFYKSELDNFPIMEPLLQITSGIFQALEIASIVF